MYKLDYIFLDLDGPILDGKARHYNCYKDIILKDGGIPIDINLYWDMKRNKIKRDVILNKSHYQGTYEHFFQQWVKCIEQKKYLLLDVVKPHVEVTLRSWRDFTKKIILITMRNNNENLLWQLQKCNIDILFDQVISCPTTKQIGGKYNALKNIHFEKAIFIGDTEEDTTTAEKLGIKSIAITNGLRDQEHLSANYYFQEIDKIDFRKILSIV